MFILHTYIYPVYLHTICHISYTPTYAPLIYLHISCVPTYYSPLLYTYIFLTHLHTICASRMYLPRFLHLHMPLVCTCIQLEYRIYIHVHIHTCTYMYIHVHPCTSISSIHTCTCQSRKRSDQKYLDLQILQFYRKLFWVTGTPFIHVKPCLKCWGLPEKRF